MTNPYGYFDDAAREYVVTRPDTPLPWLNYLGQDALFGLCTNTGGGYTFWRDARLRRLTRYRYNDVPYDSVGRYLYVRDGDTVWNPGWKPTKTPLDRYECRHGLGYCRILGAKDGVEVELLFFVPPGENAEIWKTTVRNTSGAPKELSLFSYVEFCLYEALNDLTNYQRTYFDRRGRGRGLRDLPHDRVPRAPGSLRALRLHERDRRLRHVARRLRRRAQRPARGSGAVRRCRP